MERVQRIATGAMDGNIIAAIIAIHMATIAVQAGAASRIKSLTRADGFSAFTSTKSGHPRSSREAALLSIKLRVIGQDFEPVPAERRRCIRPPKRMRSNLRSLGIGNRLASPRIYRCSQFERPEK